MSTDRLRRVMGISASPRAPATADGRTDDVDPLSELDVGDPFLSRVRLGQGGDVTLALLVVTKRAESDTDNRVRGRLIKLVPREPAGGEREGLGGWVWNGDVYSGASYFSRRACSP